MLAPPTAVSTALSRTARSSILLEERTPVWRLVFSGVRLVSDRFPPNGEGHIVTVAVRVTEPVDAAVYVSRAEIPVSAIVEGAARG